MLANGGHRQRDEGVAFGRPPNGGGNAPAGLQRLVRLVEELERFRHEHHPPTAGNGIEGGGWDAELLAVNEAELDVPHTLRARLVAGDLYHLRRHVRREYEAAGANHFGGG